MDSPGFCTFDDSLWPFLLVRLRGMPTNEEFTGYLQSMRFYLQRRESHVAVLDMLQVRMTTNEQLHQQAEWVAEHEVLLGERLLGSSFAVSSSFMRLGLNVLFYLRPPAAPYVITPSLEQAITWGATRLETVGMHACAEQVRRRYVLSAEARAVGRLLI